MKVTIRGESHDVEIDHDYGYEPDTNAHDIEWHVSDMTTDAFNALNLTDEELDAIMLQIYEALYE